MNSAESPSMNQVLWSANLCYLASLQKRQHWTVFPWCRSQRDLHLFCKFGMTCTWTNNTEKSSYQDQDFLVIVRNEFNTTWGDQEANDHCKVWRNVTNNPKSNKQYDYEYDAGQNDLAEEIRHQSGPTCLTLTLLTSALETCFCSMSGGKQQSLSEQLIWRFSYHRVGDNCFQFQQVYTALCYSTDKKKPENSKFCLYSDTL